MRPLLIAALTIASGCSLVYQPDDADRPSTAAEVDAYFTGWYEAVLDARATCSGTTLSHARTLWLGPMGSLLDRQQALFATGHLRLDRALGRDCLAAIAAAAPACTGLDAVLDDPSGACRRAFAGVVADGADCSSDAECRADARCVSGTLTCPGHCTRYRVAGEVCESTAPCGYNLRCGYAIGGAPMPPTLCWVATLPLGSGCNFAGGSPCGTGTFCGAADPMAPADTSCLPLLGYGEGCGGGACRPELFCDTGSGLCESRVPVGWGCTPGSPRQCVQNGWCDDVTVPTDPRCKAFGALGDPCGSRTAGEYAGCIDSTCDGASCVAIGNYGGACSGTQRCAPFNGSVACDSAAGLCAEACQ